MVVAVKSGLRVGNLSVIKRDLLFGEPLFPLPIFSIRSQYLAASGRYIHGRTLYFFLNWDRQTVLTETNSDRDKGSAMGIKSNSDMIRITPPRVLFPDVHRAHLLCSLLVGGCLTLAVR
jgi:hypothetical protein